MSNQTLLLETAAVVRAFAAGETDLGALQAKLQSVMSLLERSDGAAEVTQAVHDAEADLELVTFTVFGDEVRPAVMTALAPLLPHLPADSV